MRRLLRLRLRLLRRLLLLLIEAEMVMHFSCRCIILLLYVKESSCAHSPPRTRKGFVRAGMNPLPTYILRPE